MKIEVLGSPKRLPSDNQDTQVVLVKYCPKEDITIVNIDVDIVTLGIAFNIIKEKYIEYLSKLPEDVAERIERTTRKVVFNHE